MIKLPVTYGLSTLPKKMTLQQARRWGNANMPKALKKAGFQTWLFQSDVVIHGSNYLRVSYGK
jgi:hypothetical protein